MRDRTFCLSTIQQLDHPSQSPLVPIASKHLILLFHQNTQSKQTLPPSRQVKQHRRDPVHQPIPQLPAAPAITMVNWTLAWQGARKEIASMPPGSDRRKRIAEIAWLAARELVSSTTLASFAMRTLAIRRMMLKSGRLREGLRYGSRPRNVMDVYVPETAPGAEPGRQRPVVLFIHGGVWSSGALWQYAMMGARLSEAAGCVVFVTTHTFYPEIDADGMELEICEAIDYAAAQAPAFGGRADDLTLIGHSSGAHLAAMAILRRAGLARTAPPVAASPAGPASPAVPARCVFASGVYDIAQHLRHEEKRGVASLSAMARLFSPHFASHSPALLVRGQEGREGEGRTLPACHVWGASHDPVCPWAGSEGWATALSQSGLCPRVASYCWEGADHAAFVTCWGGAGKHNAAAPGEEIAARLAHLIAGGASHTP